MPHWAFMLILLLCLADGAAKSKKPPKPPPPLEPSLFPLWECNHTACRPRNVSAPPPAERRPGAPQRLAVITAGLVGRYLVNGTWLRFTAPVVQAGHAVDYYVSLSPHKYKSYTQQTYLPDPDLEPALEDDPPSLAAVCALIRARWTAVGATVRHCDVQPAPELTAAERDWVARSTMFSRIEGRLRARE
eukprot:EG_transcript_33175